MAGISSYRHFKNTGEQTIGSYFRKDTSTALILCMICESDIEAKPNDAGELVAKCWFCGFPTRGVCEGWASESVK